MGRSKPASQPILVLGALAFELAGLIPAESPMLRTVVTGAGPAKARAGLQRALAFAEPERIIALGLCGGLAPGEAIGTPAVPRAVVAEDERDEIVCDLWPGLDSRGLLVTVPAPVTTPLAKASLRESTLADWVDMESYSWAKMAREREIPFTVMRVVVDGWDDFLPNVTSPRSWLSAASLPRRSFQARKRLHEEARRILCRF